MNPQGRWTSLVIRQLVTDLADWDLGEKRVDLSPSTAEHPCLLIRKGSEGKKTGLPYIQEKWRKKKQESGGYFPEELCLETGCEEATEYPGPNQGALQGIPCHENGAEMKSS